MARQPKNPFHPGEILLEEFLEPKGVTQSAFAEKIGRTRIARAVRRTESR
jgi:plasmid maintenance system antidote protein VapI